MFLLHAVIVKLVCVLLLLHTKQSLYTSLVVYAVWFRDNNVSCASEPAAITPPSPPPEIVVVIKLLNMQVCI